ncbi:MAG: hypothetical protein R2684_02830 [Pyrinomonadaceae bacterium]
MLRAIALSLVLFVAFGAMVPLSTEYSEASIQTEMRKVRKKKRAAKYRRLATTRKKKRYRRSARRGVRRSAVAKKAVRKSVRRKRTSVRRKRSASRRKVVARKRVKRTRRYVKRRPVAKRVVARKRVQRKRVRKYSKKWWASYRAKQRRNKAVAEKKQTMRLRTQELASAKQNENVSSSERYNRIAATPSPAPQPKAAPAKKSAAVRPVATPTPPIVDGDVSMEVVGASVGGTGNVGRQSYVGGVSTTTLRRTVIDQMIRENGWVENDYQKQVGGKTVYVVVAKTQGRGNQVETRTFYFTESNGRIYRVASKSNGSGKSSEQRSEAMIKALDRAERPQQAQNDK